MKYIPDSICFDYKSIISYAFYAYWMIPIANWLFHKKIYKVK